MRLIDLSQEIYQGMSMFPMHQRTFIMTNMSYEENMELTGSKTLGFSARNLLLSEHCGTHTDGISEFDPKGPTVDAMPLTHFWGTAICLDLSFVPPSRYIEPEDLQRALDRSGQEIRKGDIVLLYTGHHEARSGTDEYQTVYTGLSFEGGCWLGERGVVNIGVDAPAIDNAMDLLPETAHPEFAGHMACAKYGMTNTENLCNLDQLVGKRFLYFGLPLKIRGGSGSPIRAVALVDER